MRFSAPLFSVLLASCAPIWAAPTASISKAKPAKLAGKIAFSALRFGRWEIYVINADGTNRTRLAIDSIQPCLSRDGKKIAFVSDKVENNKKAGIYVMNADGSHRTRTTKNRNDGNPRFSPDGKKIMFHSWRAGANRLYMMNVDGTHQIPIINNSLAGNPRFSPDGKRIVYTSDAKIFVMNADGTRPNRLSKTKADYSESCFSPNEKKIAFSTYRSNWRLEWSSEIYIMSADGTHEIGLTSSKAEDLCPCFSPDGKKIVWYSLRNGKWGIYVMNSDGTYQTRLTDGGENGQPTWAPGFVPVAVKTKS